MLSASYKTMISATILISEAQDRQLVEALLVPLR